MGSCLHSDRFGAVEGCAEDNWAAEYAKKLALKESAQRKSEIESAIQEEAAQRNQEIDVVESLVNSETKSRTEAINALKTDLQAEQMSRENDDADLRSLIEQEKKDREARAVEIETKLEVESISLQEEIDEANAKIEQETKDREVRAVEIETKLEAESISLQGEIDKVNALTDKKAPIIIEDVTGACIELNDCASEQLQGLTIYGMSEISGTASPDDVQTIYNTGEILEGILVNINGVGRTYPTPEGLRGIVDASGNHTDSSGVTRTCDTIEIDSKGMITRIERTKEIVLTGDESFVYQGASTGANTQSALISITDKEIKPNSNGGTVSKVLCTHLPPTSESIWSISNSGICVWSSSGSMNIKMRNVNCSTLDEFKAWLKSEYNKGTPVTIIAIRKEPITNALGYEDIYLEYQDASFINNESAEMRVKYIADTKSYIDRKFNEVATALAAVPANN